MSVEEQIKEAEKRIIELETNYKVAIKTIKIGSLIFVVLLAVFFGITYKQIGAVADRAVKNTTVEEVLNRAKEQVESESAKAITEIVDHTKAVASESNKAIVTSQEARKKMDEMLSDLKKKTIALTQSGDNLMVFLNSYQEEAKTCLKEIKDIVPKLAPFSVSGIAEDGQIIKPPWGKAKDWNILISPYLIEFRRDGVTPNLSYSVLGASFYAKNKDDEGWLVSAKSTHRFGQSEYFSPAAVNYILIPAGKKAPN